MISHQFLLLSITVLNDTTGDGLQVLKHIKFKQQVPQAAPNTNVVKVLL